MSMLTANLPDDCISEYTKLLQTGVHYGYARVILGEEEGKSNEVLPMVMSIGWNPYYKNEKRTAVSLSSIHARLYSYSTY